MADIGGHWGRMAGDMEPDARLATPPTKTHKQTCNDRSRAHIWMKYVQIRSFIHEIVPRRGHCTYGVTSELGSYVNSSTPIMALTVVETK